MGRPVGTKNVRVPDPPFVLEFGDSAKVILTPRQRSGKAEGDFVWYFEVAFENVEATEMTMEGVLALETMVKMSLRWTTKIDREREKLEQQLEDLKKQLTGLQR